MSNQYNILPKAFGQKLDMIEEQLREVGLSGNEIKALLTVAELGKASASVVAKKIKLPRSTAYFALESLTKHGLVASQRSGNLTYYIAGEPEALISMVADEEASWQKTLQRKKSAAEEARKLLAPFLRRENFSIPQLQFFEGRDEVEKMLFNNCAEWQRSASFFDLTYWGYQDHHFVESYRKWLNFYWSMMLPNERILLLSNESATEKSLAGKVARRQIKTMPREAQFSSTIWVVGDYIVSIMTRQKPHYAFQIKDPVFAANQRKLFQQMWRMM